LLGSCQEDKFHEPDNYAEHNVRCCRPAELTPDGREETGCIDNATWAVFK
jgi:hypothetical protein